MTPQSSPPPGREEAVPGTPATRRIIGKCLSGNKLEIIELGPRSSNRWIILIAGQHGDESIGRDVAAAACEDPEVLQSLFRLHVRMGVLVDANPDGRTARTRQNAAGADLNRDHIALEQPETRAIHRWLRERLPIALMDLHDFRPRRRALLKHGLEYDRDVLLDHSRHGALDDEDSERVRLIVSHLEAGLRARGIDHGRYMVADRAGRLRPGSTALNNLRNAVSARLGCPVIQLEHRVPTKSDCPERHSAVRRAGLVAVREFIAAAARTPSRSLRSTRTSVTLSARFRRGLPPHELPVGTDSRRCIGTIDRTETRLDVRAQLQFHNSMKLPWGYAIHRSCDYALTILHRQGFVASAGIGSAPCVAHVVHELAGTTNQPHRLRTGREYTYCDLKDYLLITEAPTTPSLGRDNQAYLALLLEPDSRFGLTRQRTDVWKTRLHEEFPMLRVLAPPAP